MKRDTIAFLILSAASLCSCTGAPMLKMDVSDYREAFTSTSDEQILTNILRARDNAPLHFSELSSLGANLQFTSSIQATAPFGELYGATTRATAQGNLGAQNNPTFSLGTLETAGFTDGLLSPVKPTLIKQFFDEGTDPRLIFMLFFSGLGDNNGTYLNNFKCNTKETRCFDHSFNYLHKIDAITRDDLIANVYVVLTPVGSTLNWPPTTGVKDLTGIDPNKNKIVVTNGVATIYSVSEPRIEFCKRAYQGAHSGFRLLSLAPLATTTSACKAEYYANENADKGITLSVRSAYQIIEYLGQVLEYQALHAAEDRCVTLNDNDKSYSCHHSQTLFQVNPALGDTLVSTIYRGSSYFVGVGRCDPEGYCDHSAEAMKIVSLVINANKSATDIPQVPLVRIAQ